MSLPLDEEIKSYLRVSTDVEDALIQQLNLSAQARVRRYLNVPLETEVRAFVGRYARLGLRREPHEQLTVSIQPTAPTAMITDVYGDTVDSATYTIDGRLGQINAVRLAQFANAPYTVAISVGWGWHPNYDVEIDPILRQAVMEIAGDWWFRRNPGVIHQSSGGSVSVTYTELAMPAKTKDLLDTLRPRGRAW